MAKGHFDAEAFFAALDAVRQRKDWTWKKVAAESKVSASTLTRMGQGRRPDVDSLAALANWSGLDPGQYVLGRTHDSADPLAMISTYLKSDPNLTPEGATALDELVKATYERLRKPGG